MVQAPGGFDLAGLVGDSMAVIEPKCKVGDRIQITLNTRSSKQVEKGAA